MKKILVFSMFLVVAIFVATVFGGEEHITGYWGDYAWTNKELAEDGDWNTASSVNSPNMFLYASPLYNGQGGRSWQCKYSSSGSQHTSGACFDYAANNSTNVWTETSYVSGKTITAPIPGGCL